MIILRKTEFWTYVGNKKNKIWLIYAYHRENGEIVAFVGENGKGNLLHCDILVKSK
ncbi:MAG: hypothetical protein LBO67_06800 [Spirochaetaceae bacterium]|jgi:IS1 family transposase|nr:hypothetical protein [Spirochaetaceae bacterium]